MVLLRDGRILTYVIEMSENKIILLCGSSLAIPVLRDLGFHNQVAVIVVPQHCTPFIEELGAFIKEAGIPLLLVNKKNLAEILTETIIKYQPALGLVFTFTFKIPPQVYSLVGKGFFNIHPGPVPAYRGPDPIFQQVKNGEPYIAVTIHKLDEGFDSGPVVMADKIRLSVNDTYGIVASNVGKLATHMVSTLMKMAEFGIVIPSRMQDNSNAKYFPRQIAADITINWEAMTATAIVALIHACNPWNKGAVTTLNNNIIRLVEAVVADDAAIAATSLPGTIVSLDETGIKIATITQCIIVRIVYCDEGFLLAARLKDFGITSGHRFTLIQV
jgi:methionyl-tRNA formyltransferase